jgi:hypothetical protein
VRWSWALTRAKTVAFANNRFYMKRQHIAKEILETEKNYVMYLGSIVTVPTQTSLHPMNR